VKHLKGRIRPEEAGKENSPWNIAADFTIDMSLSEDGMKGMLNEYEKDHHTGMDVSAIAKVIRNDHNTVRIANRIFETRLYNLFLSTEGWPHATTWTCRRLMIR
jgi:hypothetical protein